MLMRRNVAAGIGSKGSIVERLCSDLDRREPRYKSPTLLFFTFLRRCMQLGYRERDPPSIEEIFAMSDDQLFSKISSNSLHILQQFMPDRPSLNYSLRARPHNKTLIAKTTQLNDQDSIIRSIYKDLY